MMSDTNTFTYQDLLQELANKLNDKYVRPSDPMYERAERELEYIESNGQLSILSKVLEIKAFAARHNLPMLLNGKANGSLVLYLLGISNFNPMPAHYVCLSCGTIEWTNMTSFGIDLPDKNCPECSSQMHKDGFNIPIQSIWINGEGTLHFDFLTTPLLTDLYKNQFLGQQPEISFSESEEMEEIKWLSEATFESPNHMRFDDGRAVATINAKTLKNLPFISTRFINSYINQRGPVNVEHLAKLYSAENSKYCDGLSADDYLIDQNGDITQYFCDREDLLSLLLSHGIDPEIAALSTKAIRKGKGCDSLKQLPIKMPPWVYERADQAKYLFPRAHSISRIIVALQAAEYYNRYPYEYTKYHQFDTTPRR